MTEHQIAIQNALPIFDGSKVETETLKMSGAFAPAYGDEPALENRVGYAIVSYIVGPVNHKRDPESGFLERIPTLKVLQGARIDNAAGEQLLDDWRSERLRRINERNAQGTMNLTPEDIINAGSGAISEADAEAIARRAFGTETPASEVTARIPPVGYRATSCPVCEIDVLKSDAPGIEPGLYEWPNDNETPVPHPKSCKPAK